MTHEITYNHLPQLLTCKVCHNEYWRTQHWYHEINCKIGPLTTEMANEARHMPLNHAIRIGSSDLVETTVLPEVPTVDSEDSSGFDRNAYQREYMRKKRAEERAKK